MTSEASQQEGVGVVNTELERPDEHAHEHDQHTDPHPDLLHDPHAEPSAEWGWHGGFPKAARIGGWIVAAIMFLMLIGNHTGRIEDLWLVTFGLIIIGILVRDQIKRRTSWRR